LKTIHKYQLSGITEKIEMPKDAKILCVQLQGNIPDVWAEIETTSPLVMREIIVYGTGVPHNADDNMQMVRYIGTVQDTNGEVWHYYDGHEK